MERQLIKNCLDKQGQFSSGSIIELDKLVGDQFYLYIEDELFAKGEIVVIDEYFGIYIKEIIKGI